MLYYEVKRDTYLSRYRKNWTLIQGEILTAKELDKLERIFYPLNREKLFTKINVSPKNTFFSFGSRRYITQ